MFKTISLFPLFVFLVSTQACKMTDAGGDDQYVDKDPDIIYPRDSFIIAYHNFDDKISKWYESSLSGPWSAQTSDSVKRAGAKSLRFELRRTDWQYENRSQLGRAPNNNREGWFGFSLYFPTAFIRDSLEESIVDWQALPDFSSGEKWRNAPLFLGVLDDRFVLEIRTDSNRVTQENNISYERIDLGPVDKELWFDWVFHIKWAYNNTGIIEVWKQGELVFTRIGQANSYNDSTFPYLKIGINKFDWANIGNAKVNNRVLYIDEVTIGNDRASYDKVKPGRP